MSYEFVKTFPVLSQGFEIETEMSIHVVDKRMQVENVVIEYRDRPEGSNSKLNTIPDGFRVIKTILRLYKTYKPMAFFGLIALMLTAVAVAFFVPILIKYFETGQVPNFPTLIVCGFTEMAAIQAFFSGMMLESMLTKNRQDFEMNRNMVAQSLKSQCK